MCTSCEPYVYIYTLYPQLIPIMWSTVYVCERMHTEFVYIYVDIYIYIHKYGMHASRVLSIRGKWEMRACWLESSAPRPNPTAKPRQTSERARTPSYHQRDRVAFAALTDPPRPPHTHSDKQSFFFGSHRRLVALFGDGPLPPQHSGRVVYTCDTQTYTRCVAVSEMR